MFQWQYLPQPIFGLAPMDGVTDSTYRTMVWRHGPPDVLFTEFVSVEGLSRRIPALFRDLEYGHEERPMIAQIYGHEIDAFKISTRIVAKLGFDGLDINMGCPAKSVVHSGGGAALIKACPQAKKIIEACAEVLNQYYEETGKRLPLSVKTRLGYEANIVKDWISHLLETEKLSNISLHGRTLKQGYSGTADWEAIARAAELTKGTGTTLLGNGDLQSMEEALVKIHESGVSGVLFGRATYGTPWFFKEKEKYRSSFSSQEKIILEEPTRGLLERLEILTEHARLLSERKDPRCFIQIRKHIGWYLKDFPNASEWRKKLIGVQSYPELTQLISNNFD